MFEKLFNLSEYWPSEWQRKWKTTGKGNKNINREMVLGITEIRTVTRPCIKLSIICIGHSLSGSLLLSSIVFCYYRTYYDIKSLLSVIFYNQVPLPSLIAKSSQKYTWNHEESHLISGLEIRFCKKFSVLLSPGSLLSSASQFYHLPR